ncbi:MAG: acyl--CoA ligase, partial [Candidatus Lindowbacteria bacterium]|nr:acyl--CoA ligase [Candidatus Lindowbacteria bacterium]
MTTSTDRTFRQIIDEKAEQHPEKVFLVAPEPGLTLTYGQLKRDSINLGKYLPKLGLNKSDKLSFMLGNGYQTVKIFLGAMYSGFTVAPLNLMAQPSQLEYIIGHSDTRLVFFTGDQKEKVQKAASSVGRSINLVEINNDAEAIVREREDLAVAGLPDVYEDDDALLLYTSGTTGTPKGAVLSHKNLIAGGRYTTMAHELGPQDRALCSL